MHALILRWNAISLRDGATQEEFRTTLVAYRNLYAFLAQIIPFQDSDLEKHYAYIRFLLTKLPRNVSESLDLDHEVALKYYRLQKISEGSILLDKSTGGEVSAPTSVGTGKGHEEKIELSQLIDILNERFGTEFKPGDQLFFDSIREDAVADTYLREAAMANTMENFGYAFNKQLENFFISRMDQNEEITAKFMNEQEFRDLVRKLLLKQVYDQIRTGSASG